MGQFEYTSDRTEASVSFPAHKFPYTASVYYECNIRLCPLQDPECQTVTKLNLIPLPLLVQPLLLILII